MLITATNITKHFHKSNMKRFPIELSTYGEVHQEIIYGVTWRSDLSSELGVRVIYGLHRLLKGFGSGFLSFFRMIC